MTFFLTCSLHDFWFNAAFDLEYVDACYLEYIATLVLAYNLGCFLALAYVLAILFGVCTGIPRGEYSGTSFLEIACSECWNQRLFWNVGLIWNLAIMIAFFSA